MMEIVEALKEIGEKIEGALLEVNSSIEQLTETIQKGIDDANKEA